MDFKYKIADVAKEFGVPRQEGHRDRFPAVTGDAYKTGGTFGEKELNFLLEDADPRERRGRAWTRISLAVPRRKSPSRPPKAEAKKPEAKKHEAKRENRKPEKPAEKRNEKRVTLQELAADTGIKKPVAATEQVKVNRAQVSVDTRNGGRERG